MRIFRAHSRSAGWLLVIFCGVLRSMSSGTGVVLEKGAVRPAAPAGSTTDVLVGLLALDDPPARPGGVSERESLVARQLPG